MKKRIIKVVVLVAVFILAVAVFSAMTNKGNTDMTADMDSATLPTISFETANWKVNTLVGHKSEMNISAMRDTILPCKTESVYGTIHFYDAVVEAMEYKVCTLDGKEILYEASVQDVGESFSLSLGETLESGEEVVLVITLYLDDEQPIYYYTRVVKEDSFYLMENVDYIMSLHDAISSKKESEALKKGLESDGRGDNTTLQHVTIHSDLDHVLWGGLKPEVIGEVAIDIKEANASYVSAQLSYRVACAGDNNAEEIYNVKEFYKVCYRNGNYYLLAYDRTMTEIFDAGNVVLSGKGVILGMTSEDIAYKANSDGSIVAFVQERELWSYDKSEDAFSLVFSFMDAEKEDERNYYDQHAIQILSMEEDGNMTFSVYGYMNRGKHEGESGLAIYYYNSGTSSIEEKAFVKSTESLMVIEEELNQLAYYNAEQDVLYILVENNLYKENLAEDTSETIVENLQNGQYVTSEGGNMIAYQPEGVTNSAEVWNFASDSHQTVTVEEEILVPLGFVGEDFVYGVASEENRGYDSSGESVVAMHRIEICDAKNQVLKNYEAKDVYILSVSIKDNMITLKRGVKDGNSYDDIVEDYITNNKAASENKISLKSYWTDLKETQYRLLFSNSITDTKAKLLKPKHTLYESILTFESSSPEEKYFVVYGHGEQVGRFANSGDAIQLAEELSGVVISPEQNYAWEDGNRVSWYRNFEISRFVVQSGETSLAACLKKILEYEGVNADVVTELQTKAAEDILTEYTGFEGVRFRGCSAKDMFYLIDKGTPVIALRGSTSAVLLIGYDAQTVTYVEPESGSIKSCTIEKMDEMASGSGYTFIGYLK